MSDESTIEEANPPTRRFEPPPSDGGEPFWRATRDRRLDLPWCVDCDRPIWYPRAVCPDCLGTDVEWRTASGSGVVHAVSVQHRPAHPKLADRVPYAVALVDLPEGIRILSEVVGCAADDVAIGLPVTITWEPLSDGRNLPLFEPAGT